MQRSKMIKPRKYRGKKVKMTKPKPWSEFSGSSNQNFEKMPDIANAHKSDRGANYASATSNLGLFNQGKSFLGPYVGRLYGMAAMYAFQESTKLADKGMQALDKKYKSLGVDIKRWYGGITGLGSRDTGSTPDLSLYTRQIAPPVLNTPNSIGLAGEMFSNRWHINDGPKSRTLRTAVDLYKERSMTLYETNYNSPNWMNSQISQSGINRRGWYAPWRGSSSQENFISQNYSTNGIWTNGGGVYDAIGCLGLRHIYHFIRENVSNDVLVYMGQTNTSDSDLLFPVTKTRSTHRLCNNLTEAEVEVTAYLLKCKMPIQGFPLGHMFNFGRENDDPTNWAPSLAPQNGQAGPYYWSGVKVSVPAAQSGDATVLAAWDGETNTAPAVTPSLSPGFRSYWEIMDVMKQRLQPADSWEVIFERHFRHPMRWNTFKGELGKQSDGAYIMPDSDDNKVVDFYREGDYEILFSFRGLDGVVSGWETGKVSGNSPEDVKIETLAPRNVDCKRARISKTVHHEISVAWPSLVLKGEQPTQGSEELINNGFITATQRVPDTALSSDRFSRQVTIPGSGQVVTVDNWPSIGSNDAPPAIGTSKSRIEGSSFKDEL